MLCPAQTPDLSQLPLEPSLTILSHSGPHHWWLWQIPAAAPAEIHVTASVTCCTADQGQCELVGPPEPHSCSRSACVCCPARFDVVHCCSWCTAISADSTSCSSCHAPGSESVMLMLLPINRVLLLCRSTPRARPCRHFVHWPSITLVRPAARPADRPDAHYQ